ncbi:hypothetical protein [Acinetobacter sp. P1(2025)]|uniref:hypothetical protein n=1 Tax=Acinetobacter sp. P1(2025) TaxID=3446120 RepID=UPI003F52B077
MITNKLLFPIESYIDTMDISEPNQQVGTILSFAKLEINQDQQITLTGLTFKIFAAQADPVAFHNNLYLQETNIFVPLDAFYKNGVVSIDQKTMTVLRNHVLVELLDTLDAYTNDDEQDFIANHQDLIEKFSGASFREIYDQLNDLGEIELFELPNVSDHLVTIFDVINSVANNFEMYLDFITSASTVKTILEHNRPEFA